MLFLEKVLNAVFYLLDLKEAEGKEIIKVISREKTISRMVKEIVIIAIQMDMSVTHVSNYMDVQTGIRI